MSTESRTAFERLALALTEAVDQLDDDNDKDATALSAFRDAQDEVSRLLTPGWAER